MSLFFQVPKHQSSTLKTSIRKKAEDKTLLPQEASTSQVVMVKEKPVANETDTVSGSGTSPSISVGRSDGKYCDAKANDFNEKSLGDANEAQIHDSIKTLSFLKDENLQLRRYISGQKGNNHYLCFHIFLIIRDPKNSYIINLMQLLRLRKFADNIRR